MSAIPTVPEQELLSIIKQLSFCRTVAEVMLVVRVAAREVTGADGVTFVLREGENVYYAEENAIGPAMKGQAISCFCLHFRMGDAQSEVGGDREYLQRPANTA